MLVVSCLKVLLQCRVELSVPWILQGTPCLANDDRPGRGLSLVAVALLVQVADAEIDGVYQGLARVPAGHVGDAGAIEVRCHHDLVDVGLGDEALEEGVGV